MARRRIQKLSLMTPRTAYGGGAVLLALPFVGAGTFFALTGFRVVDVGMKPNTPFWVVGCIGLAFAFAGLIVGFHGVRGLLRRARRDVLKEHGRGDRPWLVDFPDGKEITDRAGSRVVGAAVGAGFFAFFLAPFNWWAYFSGQGPFMVKGIVGLFDLLALLAAGRVVYLTLQYAWYGASTLRCHDFPFLPGGRLVVTFLPNRFEELKATLRFVEERTEVSGSGRNRNVRQVAESLYEDIAELAPGSMTSEVEIAFDLPDDPALTNDLGGPRVRYWELLLEADVEGIDFRTTFPLPVYARQAAASAQPSVAPVA